jgi:hypothetical protein
MAELFGKGYQILALFNIDYHESLEEFSTELMSKPNMRFRLSIERAPLKKKTRGPKYIQPKSLRSN